MTHYPLWHECKHGNSFGMWSDEPQSCRVCRIVPALPCIRNVWDAMTPSDMLGATKLDKENFEMLTDAWTPGAVGGQR